jgi:hypothetical protein
MTRLFVAHAHRDRQLFADIHQVLQRSGYQVWYDQQPRPGADWRAEIDSAIYNADAVLVLVTPASLDSIYVTYEWSLALGMGKRVIPIYYQSVRDKRGKVHPRLQTLEAFDVAGFNDTRTFYDFFLRELRRLLAQAVSVPFAQNPPPAPASSAPAQSSVPAPQPAPQNASAPKLAYSRDIMPKERGYWLVIRRGPELNAMYQLTGNTITLGRDEANDISIKDNEVSRYHLRLLARDSGYTVEDLGSTNGTVINQTRLQPEAPFMLTAGAAIYLGDTIILSYEVVN